MHPEGAEPKAAPALYVVVPYLIVAFSLLTLYRDFNHQNVGNAVFAAFNAVVTGAAILMYIGLWNSVVDDWLGLPNFLYVDVKKPKQPAGFRTDPGAPVDWQGILHHGDRRLNRDLRPSRERRRCIGVR